MSETQSDTVLVFDAVTKAFGTFIAVNAVNINVHRGEVFGFLGPNGAGKSTTIRLLLDALRPTQGQITLFGEPNTATRSTHRRLGYLSGDMVIDTNLTGEQYLNFVANVYSKDCQQKMHELAEMLQANLSVKIGNYSRGNKQKIGLIGALMHEPELLVLDEPTSGFDPLVQETFAGLISDFRNQGGTVFMSSHILNEVQELCDRLAFIKDGKIITTTTTQKLTANAAKRVKIRAAAGVINAIHAKHPQALLFESHSPGEISCTYQGDIRHLLQYLAAHEIQDVTIREPELEEIFMHYYQDDQSIGATRNDA
jgi:ABC-2 type transport system ATP-binding protein